MPRNAMILPFGLNSNPCIKGFLILWDLKYLNNKKALHSLRQLSAISHNNPYAQPMRMNENSLFLYVFFFSHPKEDNIQEFRRSCI